MATKKQFSFTSQTMAKKVAVAADISISYKQYDMLLQHINDRLKLAAAVRDKYAETYEMVDKEYHLYLRLDAEDKKRDSDNKRGAGVKPTDTKLSLLFSQIDEALTYLLTLLAPEEAIYNAMARKDKQDVAKAFATLMNTHAEQFHHYRSLALFLLDCLKYNIGAHGVEWTKVTGNKLRNDDMQPNGISTERTIVAAGNELTCFDPYQLLLDPSVNPVDVPHLGEYFGFSAYATAFRYKFMVANGNYMEDQTKAFLKTSPGIHYYRPHPVVVPNKGTGTGTVDFYALLTARSGADSDAAKAYEYTRCCFWINPKEFGLSNQNEFQIWRFTLGGCTHILMAEHMENAHALLPLNIAQPFEDHFSMEGKGIAERLIPYQNFGSFVLNTHQRAARKKLYGLTVFDEQKIPLLKSDDTDMAGGKIAANGAGQDLDLNKAIRQFNDAPETSGTLEQIEMVHRLMQDILPTNMTQQVAGLERATQYQAAALVQSANKRNLKIAKIINAQAMDRSRMMQMMNIFQFQEQIDLVNPDGTLTTADPKQFREAGIVFSISDGLKGLDRMAMILSMKEMLNSILQSAPAQQQFDIVAIVDYYTSLLGDNTDFKQFKLQSPIDGLSIEEKNMAFQLLQAAMQQQQGQGQQQQQQPIQPKV